MSTMTQNPISPYLMLPLRSHAAAALDIHEASYQAALVRLRIRLAGQNMPLLGRTPSTLDRLLGSVA
jgi:phage baseplate assembly protein W